MSRGTFHLIPHTHWDREWYLSRSVFEARLIPMVADMLTLLESAPSLRFHFDGQAVLIDDYLGLVPGDRGRVARLVGEGRLTVGPWYVLADQLIPMGESLIRNLLIGRAVGGTLGDRSSTWYSPDAFGHPAAGPLMAGEFGIERAVIWRGAPDGGDLVRWGDHRGRSILGYHLPRDGYEVGACLVGPPERLVEAWRGLRPQLMARAKSPEIAVFVGADHHGADPRLADLAQRLQALEPEFAVTVSSLEEFFAAVEGSGSIGGTIIGELRASTRHAWSLQGVHGTRARLKRRHAVAELGLTRVGDPLVALSGAGRPVLAANWRRLIESQFHDTLAGTVSDLVAAEQGVRLDGIVAATEELIDQAINRLMGHDPDRAVEQNEQSRPTLLLWNPAARTRHGVVVAELTSFRADVLVGPPGDRVARRGPGFLPQHLVAADGTAIPLQVLTRRAGIERIDATRHYPDADQVDRVWVAFEAKQLPGLAGRGYTAQPGELSIAEGAARVRQQADGTLANELVSIRQTAREGLTIRDLVRNQHYLHLAGFEDQRDDGDCYTPQIGPNRATRTRVTSVARRATGPLIGATTARWELLGPTGLVVGRTTVSLHAGSPIVRLRLDIENQAADHRLRLHLPIGVSGDAVVGAAFGFERRPPGRADRSWIDEAKLPTDPAHRLVAVARGSRGMAVLAPGFFEYQWTRTGDLYLTLIRSIGELSRDDLSNRPGHAGWPTATPAAQELGSHLIELALVPIDEAALGDSARLHALWEDAFLPPIARWRRFGLPRVATTPGARLDGKGLAVEAIKPAERGPGIVLRVVNLSDRPTVGRWRFDRRLTSARRIRADESVVAELTLDPIGRELPFEAGPGDLVSFLVEGGFEAIGD